jgi:CDP-diacylglycerol--glycerol-3-phosphate 3-phosphatidyltransferase
MERIRNTVHDWLEAGLAPLARALLRLHVRPNQITVAGVILNLVAAGLIVSGDLVAAGLLYLIAATFDLLDGVLARLANNSTKFGAFLDSTLDRVSEGVVFAALAYRFALEGNPLDASLVVVALLGSLLVSYTRARAEGLGAECKVGVVTRPERVILLTAGLLFDLVPVVIYLLILLTALTVSQRILRTFEQLAPKG